MKKNYNKWFLSKVRKAITDYSMIEKNDRIAVGLSGGKDSIVLLYILFLLQNFVSIDPFSIIAIHVDLGFGLDTTLMEDFCKKNAIPFFRKKTDISKIIFNHKKEKSPCSLCGKLRRGALVNTALDLGCNKIALGHHLDDAIETFLMNMLFVGKMGTFHPAVYYPDKNLWTIRPLVYLPEKTIISLCRVERLPVLQNPCPVDGLTKRSEVKELIHNLETLYPDIREKLLTSLQNVDMQNLWKQR